MNLSTSLFTFRVVDGIARNRSRVAKFHCTAETTDRRYGISLFRKRFAARSQAFIPICDEKTARAKSDARLART